MENRYQAAKKFLKLWILFFCSSNRSEHVAKKPPKVDTSDVSDTLLKAITKYKNLIFRLIKDRFQNSSNFSFYHASESDIEKRYHKFEQFWGFVKFKYPSENY